MSKKTKDKMSEVQQKYFEEAFKKFSNKINANSSKGIEETRYKSWIYCYHAFNNAFKKIKDSGENLSEKKKNYLALMLSSYLASWGMYRGSSFILQYDYTIFEKVVEVIFKEKYNELWDLDKKIEEWYSHGKIEKNKVNKEIGELAKKIHNLGVGISNALWAQYKYTKTKSYFYKKLYEKEKTEENKIKDGGESDTGEDAIKISITLITKIILGTIGCYPALDEYFKAGSNLHKQGMNNFKEKNIENTLNFLVMNYEVLKNIKDSNDAKYTYKNIDENEGKEYSYPLMKILDMAYFRIGMEREYLKFVVKKDKTGKNESEKIIEDIKVNKELTDKQKSIIKTIVNIKEQNNSGFIFHELEEFEENVKKSKKLVEEFDDLVNENNKLKNYLKRYMITKIKTDGSEE